MSKTSWLCFALLLNFSLLMVASGAWSRDQGLPAGDLRINLWNLGAILILGVAVAVVRHFFKWRAVLSLSLLSVILADLLYRWVQGNEPTGPTWGLVALFNVIATVVLVSFMTRVSRQPASE